MTSNVTPIHAPQGLEGVIVADTELGGDAAAERRSS